MRSTATGWPSKGALQPGDKVVIDGADRLRDGAKVEVIAGDPKQRAGRRSAAAAAGRHGGHAGLRPTRRQRERPRWMDRLPPEVAEKLKAMSPEERRAWFQKQREELGKPGGPASN